MPPILFLIDGHALAYRTYFALTRGVPSDRWVTSKGEPTAGIYGFTSVLLRILEQDRPDYIAVAFDTGKTFRHELFPEYKATRAKMPDDLRPQVERIRQLVDVFNIPRLEYEGYEADDVLGSTARYAVEQGLGVKIITGDRDLLQLVDERIIVRLPGKSLADSQDYMSADVVKLLGVRPDQVVAYKALVGDPSDNIPGVLGIGQKTAQSLLQEYQNLDTIYKHLDDLAPGVRTKLIHGKESAYQSFQLAKIVTDLIITMDLEKARVRNFKPEKVEELLRELEFRTLLTRLKYVANTLGVEFETGQKRGQFEMFPKEIASPDEEPPYPVTVQIIQTPTQLLNLTERLKKAKRVSIDTETTSTDQMDAKLVGISISTDEGEAFYIPIGHIEPDNPQLTIPQVIEILRDPLTDPYIPKVGHNIKYDYVILARNGLKLYPIGFDTMIAEWLCNPASRNLGLKNLAWARLGLKMTTIDQVIGKGKSQITMDAVSIQDAAQYAAADTDAVLRLIPELTKEMERANAMKLFHDMEIPLIPVLADMEMRGIALDEEFLKQMSSELSGLLAEIETEVYETVGTIFNLNSTQQLADALFGRLNMKPPAGARKTASGHYSTSAPVLEALRGKHPVVDRMLDYRELSKLKSTYIDALPRQINRQTGRVHTSYNQTGSVTGRIASSNPNLQNIPIRTDLGKKVRKAFIASPRHHLLSVDYSQVELRIVAHMAADESMLSAFRAGEDIHAITAAAIYSISPDAVNADQRRRAKAINFGLIYGMSPYGLTQVTDLTLAEAEDFVDAYFRKFPGVKIFLDRTRVDAAEKGYVETLLGRRRYFPGLKDQLNRNIRNREEREAINAPVQGTAADIMKIAMIRIPNALTEEGLSARLLLQVHDELVLEVPKDELIATANLVCRVMEKAYLLDVPLKTDARYGTNWSNFLPLAI